MSRSAYLLGLALTAVAIATGGEISGRVTGARGTTVVYVDAIPGKTFRPPAAPLSVDQKGLAFQPHIAIATVGSTVEFRNDDKVAHNIFWPAIGGNKKLGHNLGTWPAGEKRSFQFATPGVVALLCNVHPEMSGYLIVTPTPYYAATDDSGVFKIADVPPGSYSLTVWHEGTRLQSKPVTVGPDQATVNFSISK